MTGPEQRRQTRRNADHFVRVSTTTTGSARQTETARMVDISEGGLCFIGSRYLVPGTSLGIEFGDCRIVAEVRHCRLREYGTTSEFFIGVQVQEILEGVETWLALTDLGD
ncbi:MAG TPA: PilZ domain-containing protein [Bryobacteraceae bacterium]|nr:PilZ domain-containing protein [Bryobacteraceae bacterium]